ncbi:hypothetical protein NP233_g10436 [Leucocoprinus birnbaumii]|uniref:mitogen-activated protein kinase kinase kinase n=1 Tax=Leucocoprinus birnbaumii TaxID=56174 RepID=A0AAD5YPV0_9AGAR|nr:hypothetical protein NP233_g10436 [Leucocoprinus birnbaumii]
MANIDRFSIVTLIFFFLSTVFVIVPIKIPIRLPYLGRRNIPINLNTAPILAIAILWASQCLGPEQIRNGIVGTEGIKPYNILILFISLAYMAITLDITGILQAAAFWVSNRGGSNGHKLYLYFYIMLTLISMILGNDPVILSGTVFLVYYTAATQLKPLAWLMSEFAAANTASMVLFVGNPTNVVICEGFGINNAAFTAYTILPFVACNVFCFVALAIQFRGKEYVPRKLNITGQLNVREVLKDPVGAIFGSIILGSCLIVVLVLSFLHIDVWKIILPFAGVKFLFDMSWDHYRYTTGRLSKADPQDEEDTVRHALQRATTATTSDFLKRNHQQPNQCHQPQSIVVRHRLSLTPIPNRPLIPIPNLLSSKRARFNKQYKALADHFPTFFTALPRLPFALIPFAFSQFILIEALTRHGWIEIFGRWLAIASGGKMFPAIWIIGVMGVILCNIAGTNIGATIFLTKIIHQAGFDGPTQRAAAISLAVASNIGAVSFTFPASLAGLLWVSILKQKKITVTQWEFAKWNSLPLLFMSGVGFAVMSNNKDDPRDPYQEVVLTFPKTWYQESSDGLNSSGMFLSGLIMVTRNRFLAWPAVMFSLNTMFNQHPARSKGDVMDHPATPFDLKKSTLRGMKRLCLKSGVFPPLLILQGVQFGGDPVEVGGFGDIWEGTYQNIRVCVKMARQIKDLKKTLFTKAFVKEAIIWSQLSHPNVLPFYGIYVLGDQRSRMALVSPWQENGNIAVYLRNKPDSARFPLVSISLGSQLIHDLTEVSAKIFDILEGLKYLHEHTIVHEDLKAATGSACLADFGLSSIAGEAEVGWTSVQTTQHGCGTVGWWAPEVFIDGNRPRCSSDIFSLASLMYEIFTGQTPFYEVSNKQAIVVRVMQGFTPTKPSLDHLSNETWTIMEMCWSRDPEKRPTVGEVKEQLHKSLTGQPSQFVDIRPKSTGEYPSPQSIRSEGLAFTEDEIKLMTHCEAQNQMLAVSSPSSSEASSDEGCFPTTSCATPPPSCSLLSTQNHQNKVGAEESIMEDRHMCERIRPAAAPLTLPTSMNPASHLTVAQRDYVAKSTSQLAFTESEVLEILVSKTRKWWLARNANGSQGLVPSDLLVEYAGGSTHHSNKDVKPQSPADPFVDKAEVWETYKVKDDEFPDELSIRKGEILDVAHKIGPSWLARKKDGTVGLVRFRRVFLVYHAVGAKPVEAHTVKAVALHDYTADPHDPRSLSFTKYEVLGIVDRTTEKWWLAQKQNGKVGRAYFKFMYSWSRQAIDDYDIESPKGFPTILSSSPPGAMGSATSAPLYPTSVATCTERKGHYHRCEGLTSCCDCSGKRNLTACFNAPPSSKVLESPQKLLEKIFSSSATCKALLQLKGDNAQSCLEILQKAIDAPETSGSLRCSVVHTMKHLCARSGVFPRNLMLQDAQLGIEPVVSENSSILKGTYKNTRICIKVLRIGEKSRCGQPMKVLLKEAMLWSQLSHPNLLPFYGICRLRDHSDGIAIVSPWQENGNISIFRHALHDSTLSSFILVHQIYDILNGLCYLHKHQIVHGDLKLANILITSSGSACLANYGLSCIVEAAGLRTPSDHTSSSSVLVSNALAPELTGLTATGLSPKTTFASDIFQFAFVFYETLTYHNTFHNATPLGKGQYNVQDSSLSPTGAVSNETWTILEGCWSSAPQDRPTATQILQRLERMYFTSSSGPPGPDPSYHHFPCPSSQLIQRRFPIRFTEADMNILLQYAALNNSSFSVQDDSENESDESSQQPAPQEYKLVQALRDHMATTASQLSFGKSEPLQILVSATEKWWLARNIHGTTGHNANHDSLPDELSVQKGEILDIAHRTGPSWLARKADGTIGRKY